MDDGADYLDTGGKVAQITANKKGAQDALYFVCRNFGLNPNDWTVNKQTSRQRHSLLL